MDFYTSQSEYMHLKRAAGGGKEETEKKKKEKRERKTMYRSVDANFSEAGTATGGVSLSTCAAHHAEFSLLLDRARESTKNNREFSKRSSEVIRSGSR
jgi:hypothetical protein